MERNHLSGTAEGIHAASEQCHQLRNAIIAQMTGVLGIDPKIAVPFANTPQKKKRISPQEMLQLAKTYVSTWLKNDILAELAATGSSVKTYELAKEAVIGKAARLRGWAAGMFQRDVVDTLNPEMIFEEVWDELADEITDSPLHSHD